MTYLLEVNNVLCYVICIELRIYFFEVELLSHLYLLQNFCATFYKLQAYLAQG